jgi:6-pyruvoyltetrahydropterin/6-carboxytetrahydropterin synthase
MYQSGKRYDHNSGFSCAFRQWKAHSHCAQLHGYPLAFDFIFESNNLDDTGWVVDFGSMKSLKGMLEDTFDHKTIIAEDDPHLDYFRQGHHLGVLDLVVLPAAGCEKFAEYVFGATETWLKDNGYTPRVTLVSVKVAEHGANHATYINPKLDITRRAFPSYGDIDL